MTTIVACKPPTTYYKVISKPCCLFDGLETEFICNGAERHLYLNVCTLLLPSDPDCCGWINVDIVIDDQSYTFVSVLFEGSQRVELPTEALDMVVNALLNETSVEIKIGRYHETLTPDNFPCLWVKCE